MGLITDTLHRFLADVPENNHTWIAYSGGVDSHVLLHAITQLRTTFPKLKFTAVHIHHGLLPNADKWASHTESICNQLNIPYKLTRINITCPAGESLEACARKLRYQAFSQHLQADDVLFTAHHQDDQAETCLLQFFRGAGPKGLASMPTTVKFASGFLSRPFLDISRQTILEYAQKHQLNWVEDTSNLDPRFTRNFLRLHVIPLLQSRWTNINKTIMRVANHCAEADQLLKTLAGKDLQTVQNHTKSTIFADKLCNFDILREKNILRQWIQWQGFPLPSEKKLQHIIKDVIHARIDSMPQIKWKGVEMRRYQNELYLFAPLPKHDPKIEIKWDIKKPLTLPVNIGILHAEPAQCLGIRPLPNKTITVKFRQGGETCKLPKRKNTHTLKKLFQEWKIPPWERNRIPLIFIDDQLAVIVGYAVCEGFNVNKDEAGIDICLCTRQT